jgi:hypothetical protein
MRMLAVKELDLVTGGLLEVPVTAPRLRPGENPVDPYGTGFDASDIYGDEGGNDVRDEVVVEAPRMTEQEKLAYDKAKQRAEATLVMLEALGIGAWGWLGASASKAGAGALAAVGYLTANGYFGETREKLLEGLTLYEFTLDGLDGKYDGNVDNEKYRHNI